MDSARNMEDLKSSNSILGPMIPDFEVLEAKIASALKKSLTADFKTASLHGRVRGTTGQSIPERKTNC